MRRSILTSLSEEPDDEASSSDKDVYDATCPARTTFSMFLFLASSVYLFVRVAAKDFCWGVLQGDRGRESRVGLLSSLPLIEDSIYKRRSTGDTKIALTDTIYEKVRSSFFPATQLFERNAWF
ncbi:putative mitochondrial protein [Sesamum alatum]|uniref:Mitochondrial protein n=1 Tax=Sesamum alatum TaxID=300844 RepID=A0AAE1YN49_9LAMI|nr:putative mitochondrial protein [Sesamum alatum]